MAELKIGAKAPDFSLPDTDGKTVRLSDFQGKKVILYFYPKDDTPGCTQEACDFRDAMPRFAEANAVIVGVSPDDGGSHEKFRRKYDLPFILLSDTEHKVAGLYGVWKKKSMYGKTFMGVERSTFYIDEQGKLAEEFRRVKVDGHVEVILNLVQ